MSIRDVVLDERLSYEALSPTGFLVRAASSHGDRIAVIDGENRWTYREFLDRCERLAGVLAPISNGHPVAVLAPNTHVLLEASYGVPWAGSALVAINTRLMPVEIAAILEHSGAAVLIVDPALASVAEQACELLAVPIVVLRADADLENRLAAAVGITEPVVDERALLSINYTSGTTGRPKGVMYSHRGAYLQALAMVGHVGLSPSSVYLWTLPMFHCNGWTFPWAVTAAAGTHVCLPKMDAGEVWRLIAAEGVTHLAGAPTVLTMLGYADEAHPVEKVVRLATGGAPPSPAILRRMAKLGFDVTHLYGLTETYGPAMICDWRPEWNSLDASEQARLKARQGVTNMVGCVGRVLGKDELDVPADGQSIGEIVLRGNNVMLGYFKDPELTTQSVTSEGWLRTGDLGVKHPDGYIELRDRSKDVIISGGENIASIEVEQCVAEHPAVAEVAVIGVPDPRWGEVPVAYVVLKPGCSASSEDIIEHVKLRIARYKAPKSVIFTDLPKTSTGKIQKYVLRSEAAKQAALLDSGA